MGALLPMRRWVAAGSEIPVHVHLIHHGNGARTGSDLREDMMMELIGPPEFGEAARPIDISGDPTSTRRADLPSSSETWTGAAITNKQKVRQSYAPGLMIKVARGYAGAKSTA